MEIVIASDPYGYSLYKDLVAYISEKHAEDVSLNDFGLNEKYYEAAHAVGRRVDEAISEGRLVRGVLCCGSGQGMAIISNKYARVFACCVTDEDQARGCRAVNNCNILTLGGRVTGTEDAKRIVDVWLETEFTKGWAPNIQEFLRQSMPEIASLDFNPAPPQTSKKRASAGCTPMPVPVENAADSCRWRILSQGGGKFRAICHFDKVDFFLIGVAWVTTVVCSIRNKLMFFWTLNLAGYYITWAFT
jgi:ribose 5-phosphate isomerase B